MRVYLDKPLQFPSEITVTLLWRDSVLWLTSTKMIMAEHTIPWKEGMETGVHLPGRSQLCWTIATTLPKDSRNYH